MRHPSHAPMRFWGLWRLCSWMLSSCVAIGRPVMYVLLSARPLLAAVSASIHECVNSVFLAATQVALYLAYVVRAHQRADDPSSGRSLPSRLPSRRSSHAPMWFWSFSSLDVEFHRGNSLACGAFGTLPGQFPSAISPSSWAASVDSTLGHAMAPGSLQASPAVESGTLTSMPALGYSDTSASRRTAQAARLLQSIGWHASHRLVT